MPDIDGTVLCMARMISQYSNDFRLTVVSWCKIQMAEDIEMLPVSVVWCCSLVIRMSLTSIGLTCASTIIKADLYQPVAQKLWNGISSFSIYYSIMVKIMVFDLVIVIDAHGLIPNTAGFSAIIHVILWDHFLKNCYNEQEKLGIMKIFRDIFI